MSHLGLFKAVLDFLHIKSVYLTDSFLQRNVIAEKCTWQNEKKNQQNFVTHYPWDLGRVHGNNENINMATTTYTWSV